MSSKKVIDFVSLSMVYNFGNKRSMHNSVILGIRRRIKELEVVIEKPRNRFQVLVL
jgi:hypothetical protein